ncbi:MAG: phosphatase PAP2 family protein [Acidimicrobiales bacterium]
MTERRVGPLAGWIEGPKVEAFDSAVDAWADRLRGNAVADRLFYGLSAVGDHGIIWHAVGLARAAMGAGTLVDAAELSAALGIEAAIVNGPIKMLFRRVRPAPEAARPHKLRQPKTSSFPSGHASAGIFAATLLASESRVRAPWFVLGGLIGWSRVHVQIHHPSDVLGGSIVGWLLGKAALSVLPRVRRR